MTNSPSLTTPLQSFSDGDRDVAEAVLRDLLPRLHQIAVRELRRERYVAPLSPTELINEVWLGWRFNPCAGRHSARLNRDIHSEQWSG